MKKFLLTMLVGVVSAVAQVYPVTNYYHLQPGDIQSLTGCLYLNGHRASVPNIQINWSGEDTAQTGGHEHSDGGRPLTSFNTSIYQDTATTYTDSTGCSTVQTRASWFAGEYFVNAVPVAPYNGFSVGYEIYTHEAVGTPFSSTYYSFLNDPNHGNTWGRYGNTVVLNDMLQAANNFRAARSGSVMYVSRVGLIDGGFYDYFSFWLPYPSVKEMHEDNQEFDALQGSDPNVAAILSKAITQAHCVVSNGSVSGFPLFFHAACF